jgi:hypothetical protein
MSAEIRKMPGVAERVETGPVQFGADWPGTFIRGDNAAHYAHYLALMMDGKIAAGDAIGRMVVQGLLCDLQSSRVVDAARDAKGG